MTIAYGPEKYIRMAEALARSYRRWNPTRPFAVVTDEKNKARLSRFYDIIVPVNYDYGKGVVQKIHVDLYTPFDETLFVDSDCLFYKDPALLWDSYRIQPFGMRGWRYLTGHSESEKQHPYEWVKDTAAFLKANGLEKLGHFNSGVYYFDSSDVARRVFEEARRIYEQRDTMGFVRFKNAPVADEPVFAVAMEKAGVPMGEWDPVHGMETAINIQRVDRINVLDRVARFYKGDVLREPALIHFNVDAQNSMIYNHEIYRLIFESSGWPSFIMKPVLGARMLRTYATQVARRSRKVLGRARNRGLALLR